MATHCSILAWRIPMDRGAWQVTVHSIAKNLTQWKRLGTHHGLYCLQLNVDEEGIEQLCLLNEWLHAPSHCPRKEIHFFYLILQMRKLTLKKVTMLCSGSQEILSKSSAQCHKQFNIQQLCCQEWTSLVAQTVKRLPIMRGKPSFDPWVGKILWRRKWQPTPVLLPGKSHRRRSMVGYSPWGHKEVDTAERLHCLLLGSSRARILGGSRIYFRDH